ncbi:beta-galactosidase [Colwellia echini]|nr:beta-galactosidase [Colwellia echini]
MLAMMGCTDNSTAIVDKTVGNLDSNNIIYSFEQDESLTAVKVVNASKSLQDNDGNKVLKIDFKSQANHESSVEFSSAKPWDWSEKGYFGLAFDITSPLVSSTHLYVSVTDSDGKTHNRSFVVPAQSSDSYVVELKGQYLNQEAGIRSNPDSWQDRYTPIIWRYGTKQINLAKVEKVTFKVIGVPEDKSLTFDNIQLVTPEATDNNYLVGLVDKFGQNAKINFENKISTVEQLIELSNQEQQALKNTTILGRSKFNGWIDGPKLKATGFYRVDKYQDKWTLIDPEGYLFYSNGLANVRMANTSTITGYDFDPNLIKQREPGDLTPEDSIGLNRAPKDAWSSRHVSSTLRADMFNWLPKYGEPMAEHFGYRREVHSGVIPKGETYSFYQANLARKYQTDDHLKIDEKWRETTLKRMQAWGFTSFGNWIDPNYYDMEEFPYFANGWIIGDFKTVSSGNDYWSPLPDPFDPKFKERAYSTVKQVASEVKNSPWCVGVFIDNEKSWGQMGNVESQYGIVISALSLEANSSPTKAKFTQILKDKYQTVNALNSAWQVDVASWKSFEQGVKLTDINDAMIKDFSTMLYVFGHKYFSVVNNAMDELMPNHLYMGVRFADWGMTPELRAAAADVVDVVSYNYYKEAINEDFWTFLEEIDRPSIIGEFHNGAVDSGLLNPGLIHAASQEDRGKKYTEYVNSAIDNPYFVGTHWFQYIDSPLTGRALDGENYNVGFVSVTDIPYQPLVDAAKKVNRNIYNRRFTNDK